MPVPCLPKLIEARQRFANGPQTDLFDDPDCLGVIRHGTAGQAGCILLVSNGAETTKIIELGPEHAGVSFRDFLGHCEEEIAADDAGKAALRVNGGSVSLRVRTDSQG